MTEKNTGEFWTDYIVRRLDAAGIQANPFAADPKLQYGCSVDTTLTSDNNTTGLVLSKGSSCTMDDLLASADFDEARRRFKQEFMEYVYVKTEGFGTYENDYAIHFLQDGTADISRNIEGTQGSLFGKYESGKNYNAKDLVEDVIQFAISEGLKPYEPPEEPARQKPTQGPSLGLSTNLSQS